jgi:hypothetical protein
LTAYLRRFESLLGIVVQETGQLETKEKVQKIGNFVEVDKSDLSTDCEYKPHHEDGQRLDTQIGMKTR